MLSLRTSFLSLALALVGTALPAAAQTYRGGADAAVTVVAEHSGIISSGQKFWMAGAAGEFGVDFFHGLGLAVNVTGTHTGNTGSNVPLSLITAAAGPRFRLYPTRRLSYFGEFLVGRANGFDSVFPGTGAASSSASSLALQAGGGLDFSLGRNFTVRAIQANWVGTRLPNAVNNRQNLFTLGAGIAMRFGGPRKY